MRPAWHAVARPTPQRSRRILPPPPFPTPSPLFPPQAAAKAKPAKKEKKEKDPNAPKRPLSSYMLFCKDERANVIKANAGMSAPDVLKALGAAWRAIGDKDKKKYEAAAEKEKEKYDKAKAAYDAKKK